MQLWSPSLFFQFFVWEQSEQAKKKTKVLRKKVLSKLGGSYNKTTQHAFTTSLGNQELTTEDQETTIATTTTSRPAEEADDQHWLITTATSTRTSSSTTTTLTSRRSTQRGRKKETGKSADRSVWRVPSATSARRTTEEQRHQHQEAEAGLIEHH